MNIKIIIYLCAVALAVPLVVSCLKDYKKLRKLSQEMLGIYRVKVDPPYPITEEEIAQSYKGIGGIIKGFHDFPIILATFILLFVGRPKIFPRLERNQRN